MYNALVSCAIGWGHTVVENGADPDRLGHALVEIIRRDGVGAASEQLCEFSMWSVVNEETDHSPEWLWPENMTDWDSVVVDGYGLAYDTDDYVEANGEFEFSILADGMLQVKHLGSGLDVSLDPFDDDALEKLDDFSEKVETSY